MNDVDFAKQLTNSAKTHDEWLAIVRFGRGTLLQDQRLLIGLICDEANRQVSRENATGLNTEVATILQELGLRFEVMPNVQSERRADTAGRTEGKWNETKTDASAQDGSPVRSTGLFGTLEEKHE